MHACARKNYADKEGSLSQWGKGKLLMKVDNKLGSYSGRQNWFHISKMD